MECAIRIKDGVDKDLSEQWLNSCNRSGWGCGGGWFAHDYFLRNGLTDPCGGNGAVMETSFPYAAADVSCACPYTHNYWIDSWAYIGNSSSVPSVDSIKNAIVNYGPVSVAVAVGSAFQAYSGGVFNATYTGGINHAVVLVGWDDINSCWIMRNSWGPNWGESGYMRIAYNCSSIGYAACWVNYNGGWVNPTTGLASSGLAGGPFTPTSTTYTLNNSKTASFNWALTHNQSWVTVSTATGTLAPAATASVAVSINSLANTLAAGTYTDTLTFSNSLGSVTTRTVTLTVNNLVLNPPGNLTAAIVNGAKKARSVRLTWQDTSNGEAKFEVYRATGSTGSFGLLATTGANATTYIDTAVTSGTSYRYEVRACSTTVCGAFSNIVTIKVK